MSYTNPYGRDDIHSLRAVAILQALNVHITGGLQKFRDDGGLIVLLPGHEMTLAIYHPVFPKDIRKKLEDIQSSLHVKFRFFDTLNFEGMSDIEIEDVQKELIERLNGAGFDDDMDMGITFSHVALNFYVTSRAKKSNIDKLKAVLKNLPGIIRASIFYNGRLEWIEQEPVKPLKKETVPGRESIISDEDMMDLKIALETDPWKLFT